MAETTQIMAEDRMKQHAFYVAEVAKAAFPYPDADHPDWRVYVNLPEITIEVPLPAQVAGGIEVSGTSSARGTRFAGKVVAPEIVVAAGSHRTAVICGEVVGARDVMEDEVESRWRPITAVAALYVFVPVGWAGDARRLIKKSKVNVARLFTYRWTPAGAEINPA